MNLENVLRLEIKNYFKNRNNLKLLLIILFEELLRNLAV